MFQNRKEMDEKMQKEGRLPPGQATTERFPVLHYGPVPYFSESSWNFRIWGDVEEPLKLTWKEFSQLPRKVMNYDLHCVTHWSKFDMLWEGVTVQSLIDSGLLKIKPSARFVVQHAENNFTANLPLDIILSERFMMATHYDNKPLTPEHGQPLRGLVGAIPGQQSDQDVYLWKGAKWLRGLEFTPEDHPGFWERAGYNNSAKIWKEERFG